ncbi:MAG: hypothetical protein HOP11_00765 [Saprospiraceae bacterium]|nr:hypothetical protein [Saprospiraceae bacterium]
MKNIIYSLSLTITLLFSCCKEEEPCSTCFENVVRCKINGKDWVSNCKSNDPLFGCWDLLCYYYFRSGNGFEIRANSSVDNNSININVFSANGGLINGLNNLASNEIGYSDFANSGNCSKYRRQDTNYFNNLVIEQIDTFNFIVIGSFSFKVHNECGDSTLITDGYFKTKFLF